MFVQRSAAVAAVMAATFPTTLFAQEAAPPEKPQYVVISFDGAHDNTLWQRSRALAAETGAHFTYFLSCVYLLSAETKAAYQAPHHSAGRSNVGFAETRHDVIARLDQIWSARSEGHEIGSHGCGHYDGKDWSKADWLSELDSFSKIVRDAYTINGIDGEPAEWKDFAETEIKGFRAPYLSTSKGLDAALSQAGFQYSASGVSDGPVDPDHKPKVPLYSLPMVPEGPRSRRIIAMDYNLYVRHSGAKEKAEESAAFSERAYQAFKTAFDAELSGKKRPLQLGFHFVLMNGGAYWHALERFAREACVRPDTKCVSYRELQALTSAPKSAGG
ncbi:polysaccharide deacetylase family protein [Tianweitania sp. BSSL-BM11]|uniref:Chitooligosaccharide deacetylase n=1 Tax=Tianweitania aestuarii TaxID=2814886 RepID=A0ABS5RRT3_9HYPH|nr:polysaccharide deacetylase family protein [Tianweitania aestuarii]MBS9719726.1 polysaccharide deacetylase family protein [Tianweitania aestuarii]